MQANQALPGDEISAQNQKPTLDRLFDTAARLFWEKGYAATTTREIASAVGIQQASLYYHIASKEDLLYQLCVSSLERLHTDVETAVGGVTGPLERVRALMAAHLNTLLTHQVRHVTIVTELRALSESHHDEVLRRRKNYAALVRSVLHDAQAAGVIRNDIPAQYLYLALLNVLNWSVRWFRGDRELSTERIIELFVPMFLEGAAASPSSLAVTAPELTGRRRKSGAGRVSSDGSDRPTAERMLHTAAVLFSRKGYAATSTREIAALLRIQKASLYYHIESKEDLLFTICQSSLEQIRRDVETAIGGVAGPFERIRTLVRAHVESMLRDQEEHAATLSEMRALSEERLAQVIALRDSYEEIVRAVLQDAQDAGVLRRDVPVKFLCLNLLGLMNRVEVWYRPNGPLSPALLGELLAVIFLTGATAAPNDGGIAIS